MKFTILSICMYSFFCVSAGLCQMENSLAKPSPSYSPLVELLNQEKNANYNFNDLNLLDYKNTTEDDLQKNTSIVETLYALFQGDSLSKNIFPKFLINDGIRYKITGTSKIYNLGNKSMSIYSKSFSNCTLIKTKEDYFLTTENTTDTIVYYQNVYYSFLKNGIILFEAFRKERIWGGLLSQSFEGISIDKVKSISNILITLTPNPTNVNCIASFDLFQSGNGTLTITNQNGTANSVLFSGDLSEGKQTIPFSINGLISGIYTVTLQLNESFYSTNLIIE